jgi:predicted alpha/beta superfamily hydrolase
LRIWKKIEVRQIQARYNRFFIANLTAVFLMLGMPFLAAQNRNKQGVTVKLESLILGEERTLSISFPGDYETSLNVYSVLYVLDAEGTQTFPQSVSTVDDLHKKGVSPQMIVVGIWNTDRNRDMIPAEVSHRPGSGASEKFLSFFREELIPYIEKTYRTENFSILYGMSNSALFAVYALLEAPETFNSYIASSPMIGHCPEYIKIKRDAFVNKNTVLNRILFMIYGTEDSQRVTNFVPDFQNYLKSHAQKDFISELVILDGEGHVPESSLSRGLEFIFSRLKK